MTINAIETAYKKDKFRSRLEARWAVFFNALGIEYQYEEEGFEFETGAFGKIRYLPDFYIPSWDKYIEIKPKHKKLTEAEFTKCGGFAQKNEKTLLLIVGDPWPSDYTIISWVPTFSEPENKTIVAVDGNRKVFALGYKTNTVYLFYVPIEPASVEGTDFWPLSQQFVGFKDGEGNISAMWVLTNEEMDAGKWPIIDDLTDSQIEVVVDIDPVAGYRLGDAYIAARQARFEHRNGTN